MRFADEYMALEKTKMALGAIAILLGIPILVSPIGTVGQFGYIISRMGAGLGLVLFGMWAIWMNW